MQENLVKTLTIRGIDEKLAGAIKKESKKRKSSINMTALKILKRAVGISEDPVFKKYDDLDQLAGTWTARAEKDFIKRTREFRKIDKEIWS